MRQTILICSMLGVIACGPGSADEGSSGTGTESGDGDGDPSGDGDGDGDPGDGDGDGDPTTGDGDGDPTEAECSDASDCALVNDCCGCDAVPSDEVPECNDPCASMMCDLTYGPPYVPEAACLVGTCVLSQVSCDLSAVTCESDPPPCVNGTVRSAHDFCYGPCVLPSMCITLPTECDANTCGDGWVCMTTQSGAPSRCVPLPPACNGVGSCDCIAPWLGTVCNGGCSDNGGTLLCEDGG